MWQGRVTYTAKGPVFGYATIVVRVVGLDHLPIELVNGGVPCHLYHGLEAGVRRLRGRIRWPGRGRVPHHSARPGHDVQGHHRTGRICAGRLQPDPRRADSGRRAGSGGDDGHPRGVTYPAHRRISSRGTDCSDGNFAAVRLVCVESALRAGPAGSGVERSRHPAYVRSHQRPPRRDHRSPRAGCAQPPRHRRLGRVAGARPDRLQARIRRFRRRVRRAAGRGVRRSAGEA